MEHYQQNVVTLQLRKFSLESLVRDYRMESTEAVSDIGSFLSENLSFIQQMFATLHQFLVKALIYVTVRYNKIDYSTGEVCDVIRLHIPSAQADTVTDIHQWLQSHIQHINTKLEKQNERDSGLIFDGVETVDFKVTLSENSSGQGAFTLPKSLAEKKAVINVQCSSQCFKYAVLAILHYDDIHRDHQRVSKYIE